MLDFILCYRQCLNEINRLLHMKFQGNFETPIAKSIHHTILYHKKGEYDRRDLQLLKLRLLVKHLTQIEKYDINLLKKLRSQVKKIRKWEDYYGWRMEVNTTALFISKNIKFIKQESPDFSIPEIDIFIECGSSHISETRRQKVNPFNKIFSKIIEKSAKHYCNPSTALFMDITNLYFNAANDTTFDSDNIKSCVMKAFKNNTKNFGSILLFCYSMTPQRYYQSNYLRIDHENIAEQLLAFMNKYYSVSDFKTGPILFPGQG